MYKEAIHVYMQKRKFNMVILSKINSCSKLKHYIFLKTALKTLLHLLCSLFFYLGFTNML